MTGRYLKKKKHTQNLLFTRPKSIVTMNHHLGSPDVQLLFYFYFSDDSRKLNRYLQYIITHRPQECIESLDNVRVHLIKPRKLNTDDYI